MKSIPMMIGMFSLVTMAAQAETIRLADGTVLEGEPGVPTEVLISTASGEKKIAFALLPADVQQRYVQKTAAEAPVAAPTTVAPAPVGEELAALANDVNLETWFQVTAIGSFRDRPEKRGTGGLVVTKGFNALEENWVTVYTPKDDVGQAGNWATQVARARRLEASVSQFMQRRWLELFIKAGEAVSRRDSNEFAATLRELRRSPLTTASLGSPRNFFTAK
jgi:hypothetical protein